MAGLTLQQKKDYAKRLYLSGDGMTQAEVAKRAGVSSKSINTWIKKDKWDELRISLLTTKEEQLVSLYRQLDALKKDIEQREKKWPTTAEGDLISKLTAAIKNLESDTSLAEKMETGKEFLRFVRKIGDFDLSNRIATLFDAFIKSCL